MTDILEPVVECECGDLRPLGQTYVRPTGGGDHQMYYEVQCVDCAVSEGADIAQLPPSIGDLMATARERDELIRKAHGLIRALARCPDYHPTVIATASRELDTCVALAEERRRAG